MKKNLLALGLLIATAAVVAQSAPDPDFAAKAKKAKDELLEAQRVSAQNCVVPAGSVGLGKFCQKKPASVSVETIDALTAAYTAKSQSDSKNQTLLIASQQEAKRLGDELSQTQTALAAAQAQIPKKSTPPSTAGAPAGIQSGATTTSTSSAAEDVREWTIEVNDITLANTFTRWAKQAGWRVRWDATKHVQVDAPDKITSTFPEAIKQVLETPGIYNSNFPLEVCFYANTPPLARITLRGQQDKECSK